MHYLMGRKKKGKRGLRASKRRTKRPADGSSAGEGVTEAKGAKNFRRARRVNLGETQNYRKPSKGSLRRWEGAQREGSMVLWLLDRKKTEERKVGGSET